MPQIAIVGAGASGLAAAHTLQDAGYTVTIFEKSSVLGGRAATRSRKGFTYDHGAQYIKNGSPASIHLITERFYSPTLITIDKPVWTFDQTNAIHEGDPAQNAEPKWSYRHGLSTLANLMANGLNIKLQTQITALRHLSSGWQLETSSERLPETFDLLLITIPIPQAAALIEHSMLDENLRSTILAQLAQAQYNPLLSVMLGYRSQLQSRPYYALVNTDRSHAISWLAWEHEKSPDRVPAGMGLLIAQMGPTYSKAHWDTPDEIIYQETIGQLTSLLAENLSSPIFNDLKRWRYALPTTRADATALNNLSLPYGLAFCGDGFVGGRVHLALEHGIDVARMLIK